MSDRDDENGGSGERPPKVEIVGAVRSFDPRPSVLAGVQVLEASRTPFALIGALALGAWGIERATKDADFAVPIGTAESAGAQFAARGSAVRPLRIGGVAVRDEAKNIRIDFIDRRFHLGAMFRDAIDEARASHRMTKVDSKDVPLVSLEHLLAMKMVSGEDKDDIDAQRILRLERLDYRKARDLIERYLGIATANRLDAFARRVGRPDLPPRRLYTNGDHTEDD